MNSRRISFWRWLALLLTLLLVPAVCVMAAFASQLQITSPYFSLSFGPPRVQGEPPLIVLTGGPNFPPVVNAEPPTGGPPPNTGGPQQPPGNNPANPAGSSCLLGLLCLSVDAGVGSTSILNVDLGKDATSTVASVLNLGQGSNQCLLGILCISTAVSQAAQSTASAGCQGVACVDVDAGVGGDSGDVALQIGAELPVVGTQLNVDPNVGSQGVQVESEVDLLGDDSSQNNDSDQGLNINLLNAVEIGVGGGTGGVSIGLGLPGLFP